jgi:hypothetical protein
VIRQWPGKFAPAIPLAIEFELFGKNNAAGIAVLFFKIHGQKTRQGAANGKDASG